jgi:uncharacterized paraquat-inducible protein A
LTGGADRFAPYPENKADRSSDMCAHCHLTTPGAQDVCHACAIALRAETRRGLREIEEFLELASAPERWLADEE